MFKADKESLEKLSFMLSPGELANIGKILDESRRQGLLTLSPEQYRQSLDVIAKVNALQLQSKVYGFRVYDSFAINQGGTGVGVELYIRQGDMLEELFVAGSRDYVLGINEAAGFLRKKRIKTIYTGDLAAAKEFLGLSHESDPEDPIICDGLDKDDIGEFRASGIEVIYLDRLL